MQALIGLLDSCGAGCCPSGETCVTVGCCLSGEEQCGSANCYDPSTSICCEDSGLHCPKSQSCVGDGQCCDAGAQRCGTLYCYFPDTEICCSGGQGSCDKGQTCCEYECCTSAGTCGSDGFCSANVCYETSTYSSTSYSTSTATVTELTSPDEDEAFGFECAPITATNSLGDTLELGDDCGLTFSPASVSAASTTALHAAREAEAQPTLQPAPRAAADDCAYTDTTYSTYIVRTTTIYTTTVTKSELSESFSCPTMAVTNAVGDELSLDDNCSLSFSPGDGSLPSATGSSGGNSGGLVSGGDSTGPSPDAASELLVSTVLVGVSLSALIGAIVL